MIIRCDLNSLLRKKGGEELSSSIGTAVFHFVNFEWVQPFRLDESRSGVGPWSETGLSPRRQVRQFYLRERGGEIWHLKPQVRRLVRSLVHGDRGRFLVRVVWKRKHTGRVIIVSRQIGERMEGERTLPSRNDCVERIVVGGIRTRRATSLFPSVAIWLSCLYLQQ